MQGTTKSREQKDFWDLLCQHVGCIASRKDGIADFLVSIHHFQGRTKRDAHWLVLPLSAGNHQDGTGAPGRIAVHPHKARFEAKYGKQIDLLRECIAILEQMGFKVPDGAKRAAGILTTPPAGEPALATTRKREPKVTPGIGYPKTFQTRKKVAL